MKYLKWIVTLLVVAVGFGLFLNAWAWLARPAVDETALPQYTAEEVAEAERLREQRLNTEDPPVLVREVDYSEGESARWYPKGEAPILAELVAEGKLPLVAERVGPEPIVVEGPEGIGNYGGTWMRAGGALGSPLQMFCELGYQSLVRWSPQGYPIVPHLAKRWEVSDDNREYVFYLRKGMRWSDGHPFTADDILYWWQQEQLDSALVTIPIPIIHIGGELGDIQKIDDHTFRVVFPHPNGLFLENLAGPWGLNIASAPAHYLRPYHPTLGDQDLIEREMARRNVSSPILLYWDVKKFDNPEHPRLAPWIYRTYRSNPPLTFVRNPYYCMVDTEGNQLPYLDRWFIEDKPQDMINIAAGNGELSMQGMGLRYRDYTYLMSQSRRSGYQLRHWYSADRSRWFIAPNLNRLIDPARPETAKQHALLNDKRFRQALSLAINRQVIIDAEFNGQAEPAQVAPGPESPFYHADAYKRFTEYDPARANELLDELGLTERDAEGFRTFPDGSQMLFFMPVSYGASDLMGPAQFVKEDFERVGLRTLIREKSGALFYTELMAREYSLGVGWISQVEHLPHLEPRLFMPLNMASTQAIGYAKWYMKGGFHGDPQAEGPGCVALPQEHPLYRATSLYEELSKYSDPAKQKAYLDQMLDIAAENVWTINICTAPPVLYVVQDGFRNVPEMAVHTWMFISPGNTGFETFYFDEPSDSAGAVAQVREEILTVTPAQMDVDAPTLVQGETEAGNTLGRIVRFLVLGVCLVALMLVAVRHPYIGHRLLLMIPMLIVISVVTFVVIQAPPGDYVSSLIMQLRESGSEGDLQRIEQLKREFYLEDPMPVRYARWMGLYWFNGFEAKDKGLLQGYMGRSMETGQRVNDLVGERLLLTFLISLGTILFTWVTAIPIGIYSAVRQYSILDYALTFIGFIGMCIPGFLLALLLIYASSELLGIKVSGLFSPEFASQPEWNAAKVKDLLQHVWVPVVVLGVGGTAGMIRVMRGNLLDELKKPYVITAMAKGVRPTKLLFKYPVRLALNPFISGIGGIFPMLVSGGAIVAMVLSLPTVGPLMLSALMSEDMYLAGSMLMVLSLLGIFGTLVSDLLLLCLDPRIRYEGSSR